MAVIDPITLTLPASSHDGTEVVLRTLDGADAGDYVRFMKEVLSTSKYLNKYPHEYTLTSWKQRAILRSRIDSPTSFFAGVFHNNQMVGMIQSKGDSRMRHQHKVEMGIALKQGWRGRGLGRAIMTFYIDWCRNTPPISKIELNVNAENLKAIKLYEDLGFEKEGRRRMALNMGDGTYNDDIFMGLILNKNSSEAL